MGSKTRYGPSVGRNYKIKAFPMFCSLLRITIEHNETRTQTPIVISFILLFIFRSLRYLSCKKPFKNKILYFHKNNTFIYNFILIMNTQTELNVFSEKCHCIKPPALLAFSFEKSPKISKLKFEISKKSKISRIFEDMHFWIFSQFRF